MRISDWSSDVCSSDLNTATLIACWLGAIRAGCVAVTTVPLLRGPDLAPIVTRASPLLALIDARTVTAMGGVEWIEAAGCRTLTFDGDFGDGELERRLKQQPPSPKAHDSHRDDPALWADRKSVGWGKGVSVGVDHGCRRVIKKKKTQ